MWCVFFHKSHLYTSVPKRAFIGVCFCSCARPPCIFFVSELLKTLMVFLWRVREVLGRCLREGHIARGVSQDTCPMIMFMKIITGLGSRRVPSLENSGGLNFKLYCYPLKKKWRDWSPCPRNVCTIGKVSLLTVKAGCLFSSLLFSDPCSRISQYNCTEEHKLCKHKSADFNAKGRQDVPTCSDHNRLMIAFETAGNRTAVVQCIDYYVPSNHWLHYMLFGHLIPIGIFHQIGKHL